MFNLFRKKKEEPRKAVITEVNYLVDTENEDRVRKYYNKDLIENDEYYQSAKELKEYYDHERVWKYEPVEIPFRMEGQEVYTDLDGEWIRIGRVKRNADLDGKLICCFYVCEYKYVTEDSVEKEKGDDYFGIEVTKVITL